MQRHPVVILSALALVLAAPAGAQLPCTGTPCSTAIFGSTTADPLFINSVVTVTSTCCVFDFAGRHVVLGPGCTINVPNAQFNCGQLTMQGGSLVRSRLNGNPFGGTIVWNVVAAGANDGSATVAGTIDVDDPNGAGGIRINATGYATINGTGRLSAHGTTALAWGGTVDINAAGPVYVNGAGTTIDVSSGNDETGGDVTLVSSASWVETAKVINADGGAWDGGTVWIDAATYVAIGGRVEASGSGNGQGDYGWGGWIDVYAGTDIVITNDISANGPSGTAYDGGGDGGYIYLDAGGSITVIGTIRAEAGYDATGGDIDAYAGTFFAQPAGILSTRGKDPGSQGGTVNVDAGTTATFAGTCDVSVPASGYWAGDITVSADAGISVPGTMLADGNRGGTEFLDSSAGPITCSGSLDVHGTGTGGRAGVVGLRSFAATDLSGAVIDARGASTTGRGGCVGVDAGFHLLADATTDILASGNPTNSASPGWIQLKGCRVTLPAGSRVLARGTIVPPAPPPASANWPCVTDRIRITAGDVLTIAGEVRGELGAVSLRTRIDAPWSPVLTGSTIVPAATIAHEPSLPPCLARLSTTFTAVTPVLQGGNIDIALNSVPNRPLFIVWDVVPGVPQSLGAFGYTQNTIFGTWPGGTTTLYPPLADGLLLSGWPASFCPPCIASGAADATDGNGDWRFILGPVFAPGLIGLTIYLDAYVIDPGAQNGVFHQPKRVTYTFQ